MLECYDIFTSRVKRKALRITKNYIISRRKIKVKKNNIFYILVTVLFLSLISPGFAHANVDSSIEEQKRAIALSESILFNLNTEKLEIDKGLAQEKYAFPNSELNRIENVLDSLDVEETKNLLLAQGIDMENYEGEILFKEDRDGVIQPFALPVIWLAGIGLVSFIGYLFYDKYLTDREKRNLINRCYDSGGSPVIDERDTSGRFGTTSDTAAITIGGFNFACARN